MVLAETKCWLNVSGQPQEKQQEIVATYVSESKGENNAVMLQPRESVFRTAYISVLFAVWGGESRVAIPTPSGTRRLSKFFHQAILEHLGAVDPCVYQRG